MTKTILRDDMLFHPVHGVCCVVATSRAVQTQELSYTFAPVTQGKTKTRFMVPESALGDSGFNKLMSIKEGKAILEYFKIGKKKDSKNSQAWKLALLIWSESSSKDLMKKARRHQQMDFAVKGLTAELSFVLKMTLREVAEKIQQNLGRISEINPLVLTALANIDKP